MKRVFPRTWRQRGRLVGFAILCACAVSANSDAFARTGQPTLGISEARLDFTTAQLAAREHLDRFFRFVLDDDGVGRSGAALRIAVPKADGGHDLVWISPFRQESRQFRGLRHATGGGESVQFDRSQVVDWSFAGPDGRLYGNFATRLFLQTLTPEQAEDIASALSDRPAPEEWLR